MSAERVGLWAVDRIEGETVVLVEDGSGRIVEVARAAIGAGVREGTILRVPLSPSGALLWRRAAADPKAEEARREEGRRILDELRRRDPGGDVEL